MDVTGRNTPAAAAGVRDLWRWLRTLGARPPRPRQAWGGTAWLAACVLALGMAVPARAQVVLNGTNEGSSFSVPSVGITASADEYVGQTANGTITQTQGTNNAAGYQVYVGDNLGLGYVTGTYDLSGGALEAAGEQLGLAGGEGNFVQTGGTNSVSTLAVIGAFGAVETQASASYVLGGGTLNATSIAVGTESTNDSASFAFNGGTADFGTLTLAAGGAITASGNEVLDSAANLSQGNGAYAVNQTGGSNTLESGAIELGVSGRTIGVVGGSSSFAPNIGTATISGGLLGAEGAAIGLAGTGAVVQTGGKVEIASVGGAAGTLTLSDGSTETIGTMLLGGAATGSGSYTLQAGTLFGAYETLGGNGHGSVVQTGGTNTAAISLVVSSGNTGASGSYDLKAGTLTAGSVVVNSAGTLTFGGGNLVSDQLTLAGGAVVATGDETEAAASPADVVQIRQTSGSNTVASGTLFVGAASAQGTTYLQSGGTISALNETVSAGNNTFDQTGGTNTVSALTVSGSGGTAGYDLGAGTLRAGAIGVTSSGSLLLEPGGNADFGTLALAGSLSARTNEVLDTAGQTHASYSVTQTGGSNTALSALELGAAAGNTGSYTLSAGTITASAEVIGLAGAGSLTQTGGTNTVNAGGPAVTLSDGSTLAAGTLQIGLDTGSSGSYSLAGGTLAANTIVAANGSFALSGGSAEAVTNNGGFTETGGGTLASLTNNATASAAGTLTVAGATSNAGSLTLAGGTVTTGGGLTNTGTISGTGTIGGAGAFTNSGTLVQSGGVLTLGAAAGAPSGTDDNTGEIDLAAGTATPFQIAAGVTLTNDGVVKLNDGAFAGLGTLDNRSGIIGGTGRIGTVGFFNGGTLVADAGLTSVTATITNAGVIEMTGTSALLSGGTIANSGTIEGAGRINNSIQSDGGANTIQAIGGTLTLGGSVAAATGTTFIAGTGTKLLITGAMPTNSGIISLAGGSFDTNGQAITNDGTISGYGSFASGGLTNQATLLVAGGTATVNGAVTNAASGAITVDHASVVFNGAVTNNGTVHTILGTASYAGTFTNNGTVISDPSTQIFTGDLVEGSAGVIQASVGDKYIVEGGFLNHSTQNTSWNTTGASLEFAAGGASATHSLLLAGSDLGATAAGYTNNFSWNSLVVDSGQSLALGDGVSAADVAFYADIVSGALVSGGSISNIAGNGYNIYYDPLYAANAYLNGLSYSLAGGGQLIADSVPTPEPASLGLLATGLLGAFAVRRRGLGGAGTRG